MASSFSLAQQAQIVSALAPAADAAGRTGAYVTLKNAHKAFIVVHIAQGNAATVGLTLLQATAVAGTGSKALSANQRIWAALDVGTTDALVRQADAASFTTDAALKNKLVLFEVDPASLDTANGYDCIAVVTGASNVANITAALYELMPLRFDGNPPPSAIVD